MYTNVYKIECLSRTNFSNLREVKPMNRILSIIFTVTVIVGASAIVGCDSEDNKTYDVTVSWLISDMPELPPVLHPWLKPDSAFSRK